MNDVRYRSCHFTELENVISQVGSSSDKNNKSNFRKGQKENFTKMPLELRRGTRKVDELLSKLGLRWKIWAETL